MSILNDLDVQELREMFPQLHASVIEMHAMTANGVVSREVKHTGEAPVPMLLRAAAHAVVLMRIAKDRNDAAGFDFGRDSFWWAIDCHRKAVSHA